MPAAVTFSKDDILELAHKALRRGEHDGLLRVLSERAGHPQTDYMVRLIAADDLLDAPPPAPPATLDTIAQQLDTLTRVLTQHTEATR